jgi:hypothetical protein
MKSHLYLKEVNSIPKEYRQDKLSSKGFFDEINRTSTRSSGISAHHSKKMA